MELNLAAPLLALAAGEVVTLDDACGIRIHARMGSVWVTEESNLRDHVVGPGETHVVSRDGRTLIQALQPAWVALGEPKAANDAFQEASALAARSHLSPWCRVALRRARCERAVTDARAASHLRS